MDPCSSEGFLTTVRSGLRGARPQGEEKEKEVHCLPQGEMRRVLSACLSGPA